MLHADLTSHLGKIGNFARVQEIRFGNLEFTANSRGDLSLTEPSVSSDGPETLEALTSGPLSVPTFRSIPIGELALSLDSVIAPEHQGSILAEYAPREDVPEFGSEDPRD